MATMKRYKTNYPGVYFIKSNVPWNGKQENIFYIRYRKDGKLIEEKAGRQYQDAMTAAKASNIRSMRINGRELSNEERRLAEEQGKLDQDNNWTINKIWNHYLEAKAHLKSVKTDNYVYNKHIKPEFGMKLPKDLLPSDIDNLRITMSKKYAPQTVRYTLQLIKRTINYGYKKNLCDRLLFTIEMPKINNVTTEDLNPDQLQKLLQAIDEDSNIQAGNMMKLALYTGMRRGEMFRLQWQDIDYNRGFIHLRDPKGGVDQKIPLNDTARELLLSHPREDSEYVFPGRKGKQRIDINKQVSRIKVRAGLPKNFRALHGLRHVYASILASSGRVDMYTLQKLLTHKSPQMTQRYAHLRDETLQNASAVMDDLLKEANPDNLGKKVVGSDDVE